ncbi:biotin-dependent carboxyltransferase family protein [Endozoicomonas sp. Mp262]|uniref:5-oxoprolinase subunit C family protein n=1 Tax=Endozoicomonas sp. Mp262 TaxID=2919499 RepID=UPI0021DB5EDA
MTLRIIEPGPLSLIQDLGRYGYQHIGVSPGGPMDEQAFLWANKLLANQSNDAQIEINLGMFRCEFLAQTTIAITGADMAAELNGVVIKPWQSYSVKPGDTLSFKGSQNGLRVYLAVRGGFEVPEILGSCSTVARDQLGGLHEDGSKLRAGDCLNYTASDPMLTRQVPEVFIPDYSQDITLEVIPGYQYEWFDKHERYRFFNAAYTLSQQIDRMGYRLSGEAIGCREQGLISEGIALGAIQIPADGQPIILMRDRQTIGGYPKIGCVKIKDLSPLAQCIPGATIRFVEKDLYKAEAEYRQIKLFFSRTASSYK